MAEEAIIKVSVEGSNAKKTVGEVRKELEATEQAAKKTTDSLGNGINAAEFGSNKLKTALRQMKEQLQGMDSESQAFRTLAARAAALEDKISDVNNRVKLLSSDTRKLDTLVGTGMGIAGAFQAASGAMALFGSNSEKVQNAIKNVIAVQGILNGVQTVANVLNKDHIVGMQLRMAAEKAQIGLTKAWTAAQRALNIVMSANPIGLIVAAVAALGAGIYFLIKGLKEGTISFEQLGKVIIRIINPMMLLYDLYQKFWSDEAKANKEREKQQAKRTEDFKKQIQEIKDKRAEEKKAFDERQHGYDLTIARMEAEGKNSNKLKLQKLQDALDETKAVLKANEDIIAATVKRYETEAALRGMSRDQFLKSIGIDAEIAEKQINDQLQGQRDAIFEAETNIIALKTQMREKNNADAKSKQAELDALAKKAYDEELKRLHDLQAERNRVLDEVIKLENAYTDSQLTAQERETNAVRDKYFTLIEEAEQFGIDSALLKEAQEAELLAIEQKYLDLEFDALEAQIDKENELKQKAADEEKARREQLVADTISSAENLTNIVESINSIASSREIERIKKKEQAGEKLTANEIKRLRRQEKVEKAIAIAKVASDTAKGISAAVAAGAGIPFPANIPAIISGVAAVLAGVAQANSILGESTDTGNPITETATSGDVQDLSNQTPNVDAITSGSTLLNQEPQKVYVVESEITNVQNNVAAIVAQNTWG